MQKFSLGTKFCGQAALTKIKPRKICTHQKFATVITVGYSVLSRTKINLLENLTNEIL